MKFHAVPLASYLFFLFISMPGFAGTALAADSPVTEDPGCFVLYDAQTRSFYVYCPPTDTQLPASPAEGGTPAPDWEGEYGTIMEYPAPVDVFEDWADDYEF